MPASQPPYPTHIPLAYGATGAYGKKSCIWRTAYVQHFTYSRNVRQELTPESSRMYASSRNLNESPMST